MKLITKNMENLKGKTIKDAKFVDFDKSVALVFTDNTYTIIRSFQSFEETEVDFDESPEDYVLLEAEIITKDEYKKIKLQKQLEFQEETRKGELQQLRILQKKYQTFG